MFWKRGFDGIITSKEIKRKRILFLRFKEDRFVPVLEKQLQLLRYR